MRKDIGLPRQPPVEPQRDIAGMRSVRVKKSRRTAGRGKQGCVPMDGKFPQSVIENILEHRSE